MKNKLDKPARPDDQSGREVREIRLDQIIPNRFQPRKMMDQESLQELIDSIRTHGVLEPIVVRQVSQSAGQSRHPVSGKTGGPADRKTGRPEDRKTSQPPTYEIIMGERRFRACQALQKETIPAVVKEADDRQMLEWALIENTHRKDLNPIERAKAYQQLAETFHLTHQQVAERVGVDRTTVTNFIRLLTLPTEIQADMERQTIKLGQALVILAVPDSTRRLALWQRVKNEDLSVRHLKILVDAYLHPRGVAVGVGRSPQLKEFHVGNDESLRDPAQKLYRKFGLPVRISYSKFGNQFMFGSISITCDSEEELRRILKIME